MFGSNVCEVALGMILCFGSVALIASSIQEAVASILRWRARTLLAGISNLLNGRDLVVDIYNHALANPRSDGGASTMADISMKYAPSYIRPEDFSRALVDSLQKDGATFQQLPAVIATIGDKQLETCLLGMYNRSVGSTEKFEDSVARWFDSAMDRVSGAYKRKAQLWTFIFALAVAVIFNVDAHQVMTALWNLAINHHGPAIPTDPKAITSVDDALATFDRLPIGWSRLWPLNPAIRDEAIVWAAFGWIVTASAALFGAPFWFGLLGKVVNLRGVGKAPPN
ncbi:MAG TPA: hypothetical protein VME63_00650 [Dyella sp.]|uniref:hypothetical protein n=1 Tax=Dyella sp. TaxID=1869338 RepID=UPI002D1428EC|nr:hypothetical protein [Dyella sp.]HTV83885.1 hypothetical protein [Dyella sp.]